MRPFRWLVLIAGIAAPAPAQQITSLTGNVSVRSADDAPWTPATAGMALAAGTTISTGPKATAEIRVDASDSFVTGPKSQCKLVSLDSGRYQLEFTAGRITYQSAGPAAYPLQVNLPSVAVEPVQPGIYVITQAAGGQSQIAVQAGLARVIAPTGSELVNIGQTMLVRDTGSGVEFRVVSAMSRWRRFMMVAGAVIQIAGNVSSGGGGGGGSDESRKSLSATAKSAANTSKPVDSRQRSDPPAKPGPPPATPAPVSRGK
jgi:hypothetical protein